ncbi:MAG TPA: hypothetical protein VG937_10825 [Polyangiaceae bacterium]|jgi:hypothetical protein|nr:hypothetical protein [Polyangiaceae bacterium]
MELPPITELRHATQLYAQALSALELSPGEQPLVLPNADWFPDRFSADQDSLERLVARMQGYAGLEAAEIDVTLMGDFAEAGCDSGGCGTGACSTPKAELLAPRLSSFGNGRYGIEMPAKALGHSIAFTASIARMLGQVRLLEAGHESADPALGELSAVGLGFGVLLLEASHLYAKGCGGPSIGKATALGCNQLALPFALFVATEGHKMRPALAELAVTQRAVVDEAWALVQSNRALIERLKTDPERVARGDFKLGEARSWLSRLFSGNGEQRAKSADRDLAALEALERGESLDEVASLLGAEPTRESSASKRTTAPEKDDLRSLVDEALSELRGDPNQRTAAE